MQFNIRLACFLATFFIAVFPSDKVDYLFWRAPNELSQINYEVVLLARFNDDNNSKGNLNNEIKQTTLQTMVATAIKTSKSDKSPTKANTTKPQLQKVKTLSSRNNISTNTISSFDFNIKLNKDGAPEKCSRIITGTASAYTENGFTSTGKHTQVGFVAVDPNVIPYGSKLYITSKDGKYVYGCAYAEDTGGFVKWNTRVVDLFLPTENDCVQFGLRDVNIYIL